MRCAPRHSTHVHAQQVDRLTWQRSCCFADLSGRSWYWHQAWHRHGNIIKYTLAGAFVAAPTHGRSLCHHVRRLANSIAAAGVAELNPEWTSGTWSVPGMFSAAQRSDSSSSWGEKIVLLRRLAPPDVPPGLRLWTSHVTRSHFSAGRARFLRQAAALPHLPGRFHHVRQPPCLQQPGHVKSLADPDHHGGTSHCHRLLPQRALSSRMATWTRTHRQRPVPRPTRTIGTSSGRPGHAALARHARARPSTIADCARNGHTRVAVAVAANPT